MTTAWKHPQTNQERAYRAELISLAGRSLLFKSNDSSSVTPEHNTSALMIYTCDFNVSNTNIWHYCNDMFYYIIVYKLQTRWEESEVKGQPSPSAVWFSCEQREDLKVQQEVLIRNLWTVSDKDDFLTFHEFIKKEMNHKPGLYVNWWICVIWLLDQYSWLSSA